MGTALCDPIHEKQYTKFNFGEFSLNDSTVASRQGEDNTDKLRHCLQDVGDHTGPYLPDFIDVNNIGYHNSFVSVFPMIRTNSLSRLLTVSAFLSYFQYVL